MNADLSTVDGCDRQKQPCGDSDTYVLQHQYKKNCGQTDIENPDHHQDSAIRRIMPRRLDFGGRHFDRNLPNLRFWSFGLREILKRIESEQRCCRLRLRGVL